MKPVTSVALTTLLQEMVAARTPLPCAEVATDAPLTSFGLGSVDLVGMVGELESTLGRPVDANVVWRHPTIAALAEHLAGDVAAPEAPRRVAEATVDPVGPATRVPVALVGIGCRLPGGVSDAAGLWRALTEGTDAVGSVPPSRWDGAALRGDPRLSGALLTDQGGFVADADRFDHAFFGISGREAARMDPQQRLLVEVAWHALQDAGVRVASLAGTSSAVVMGLSNADFPRSAPRQDADAHTATGSAGAVAANRLSYLWDLHGPSLTLDTACSSSLVAIHQAAELVASGAVPVALAGGVNLLLEPDVNAAFTKMDVLSPGGRCRPFAADADGIVRSEGAVVVVLKPLPAALAEGDRIYCVVRGGAVNSDGRTNGLTAPNPDAQEEVLRAAYRHAGVDPRTVGYVEAHGTGTLLGDPIEASALGAVLGSAHQPVAIGSAKSNFGHTEACAGAVGVAKAALMLHHRRFVPTVHLRRPNPRIDFAALGLRLADTAAWDAASPRVAGVSGFGFGGTNAHLVLEEAPTPERAVPTAPGPVALLVSGRDEAGLSAAASGLAEAVAAAGPDDLAAFAAATGTRRDRHEHWAAVCGDTADELAATLRAVADGTATPRAARGAEGAARRGDPIMVFAGQGSAYWPVPGDVLAAEPMAALLGRAQSHLEQLWDGDGAAPSLPDLLSAPADDHRLSDPAIGQVAFAAYQMGLFELWRAWGLRPAAVVGHSLGEVAAAYAAGALDLGQAVEVALRRGRAIAPELGRGAMCVVGLTPEATAAALSVTGEEELWFAGANGPTTSIVSGTPAAVARLVTRLEDEGVFVRRIIADASYGSHCPLMAAAAGRLAASLAGLRPHPTTLPLRSTVTAETVEGEALDAVYWARNLASPVAFDRAVEALLDDGADCFLEVAARPGLGLAIRERLEASGRTGTSHSTLPKEPPGLAGVLLTAGELHASGVRLDWAAVHGGSRRHRDLPLQRFADTRHPLHGAGTGAAPVTGHPLLRGGITPADRPHQRLWSARLDAAASSWLLDHRVGGAAVVPGALWLETLAGAARRLLGDMAVLERVRLLRPVPVEAGADDGDTVQVCVSRTGGELELTLHARIGEEWVCAVSASARTAALDADSDALLSGRSRCREDVAVPALYTRLADAGLEYGEAFRGLKEAWSGAGEAVVRLRAVPELVADPASYLLHPVVLDAALQSVAVALSSADRGPLVPAAFGHVRLTGGPAAWARAVIEDDACDGVTARLELFDEDGRTTGILAGARFVSPSGAAAGLEGSVLRLAWEPPAELPHRTGLHGVWLHVHAGAPDAEALAEVLAAAGATVRSHDTRSGTDLADSLSCRPAGILHTVGLGAAPGVAPATDAVVASLLGLAQGVARAGCEPQRTVVCTRGVHGPGSAETSVAGGAAWGFTRVASLEVPALRPVLLDLGDAGPRAGADLLVRVAGADTGRHAEWLATADGPRVARLRPLEVGDPLPWPGGEHASAMGNRTILAEHPGILDSLCQVAGARMAPAPDEVEIAVAAAGLNFNDVLKALDTCPGVAPGVSPLGAECSGTVTRVGAAVTHVRPGDTVMAVARSAMSAFVTAPGSHVAPLPGAVDVVAAGGVPIVFLTAVYGLEHLARIRPGETVLIHSATGGVGAAALQVAARRGARVLVTAGSPEKRAELEAQGLGPVMDSRSLDFVDQVREHTGGRGVDVVVNFLTGPALLGGLSLLAPGGRFIEIGKQDIYADTSIGLGRLRGNRSFLGLDLEQVISDDPELLSELLTDVVDGLAAGDFTPPRTEVYGFSAAQEAFGRMARAEHRGKIVLVPDAAAEPVLRHGPSGRRGARLITGGLGALGLRTAAMLVQAGARHLVLAGRSAPGGAAAAAIDGWREDGVRVDVERLDVSDSDAVSAWLATLDAPLVGVYHAAGVLDDGAVAGLDAERCDRVLAPKVAGAWHLHEATRGMPVGEFVLFSSAAGLLGSPGQANYAAANTALDALAHHRAALGLPCLSVQWGPWLEAGLAAGPDGGASALSAMGVRGIRPEQGVAMLGRLGDSGLTQACVLPVDPAALAAGADTGMLPPLLATLAGPAARPVAATGLREEWEALPIGRPRRRAVQRHLCEQIGLVLRQDPDSGVTSRPLSGMGFDSLMSLELRRRLERTSGVELPATLVWRHPTVDALTPVFAELVGVPLTVPDADAHAQPAPPTADVVVEDDLDLMTNEELEALLRSTIEEESSR